MLDGEKLATSPSYREHNNDFTSDQALHELLQVKKQYEDIVKKCDHARRDVDVYKNEYESLKAKVMVVMSIL